MQAIVAGVRLVHVREEGVASGMSVSVGSAIAIGGQAIPVDLARLAAAPNPLDLASEAVREARLNAALLVAGPIEALANPAEPVIRLLADSGWPTVLVGTKPWDPQWSRTVPLLLDAPQTDPSERSAQWREALGPDLAAANGHATELIEATRAFHLGITQIERAAEAGRLRALAESRPLEAADLRAGARAQNSAGLERLAHRIAPAADWNDLVLPPDVQSPLLELTGRARHRELVHDEWQIGGRSSRGRGITALVRRGVRDGQDARRRGHRRRARSRPVRHRPVDRHRQVHRRDREEPRPDLLGSRRA